MFAARSCISWLAARAGRIRLTPSRAPFGWRRRLPPPVERGRRARSLVGLDPLPLAVDVATRSGPRRRRTRGDGGGRSSTAIAALTSVRSKTPSSAASWAWRTTWSRRSPSSSARAGVAPGAERVVDLVRLLEEVVPERLVGLLAIPRAAVGQAQAGRDPGHRPGAGDGQLRGDGREVERRRQVVRPSARRSSAPPAAPNRPTGWSAGIEPAQERDRVVAARRRGGPASGSAGDRPSRRRPGGPPPARSAPAATARAACATRRSAAMTWSPARGRAPSGAAPRRRARRARVGYWPLSVGEEVAGDRDRGLLLAYQFVKALALIVASWSASGVRVSSATTLNRYSAVAGHVDDVADLADRGREDRRGQAVVELALVRPSRCRRPCRPSGRPSSRGRAGEVGAAVGLRLELASSRRCPAGRYMIWMTCQPKALLTGCEQVAGLEARP